MHHRPLEIVTTCNPVIVVNRLGTVLRNFYEIASCRQFTVEVVGSNLNSFVRSKATCGFFYDSKSLGKRLFEGYIYAFEHFFLEFVDLGEEYFTVFDGSVLNFCANLSDFCVEVIPRTLDITLEFFGLCTQLVVAECFEGRRYRLDFLHPRLNFLHIAGSLTTKNLGE